MSTSFSCLLSRRGISLDRLNTLVMVANQGSIAAAAGKDNLIRQSQFSRQLKELGTCLGCRLTELKGGTAALTPHGRRLAALAREHLLALDRFAVEIRNDALTIRIGAGESALNWLLIPNQPTPKDSAITWHYFNLQAEDIKERLIDQRLDFGIVRNTEPTNKLKCTNIGILGTNLFAPKSIVGESDYTPAQALTSLPLALLDGRTEVRDRIEELCQKQNRTPNIKYECTTALQIAALISSGKAAGPLPSTAKLTFNSSAVQEFQLNRILGKPRHLQLAWNPRTIDTNPKLDRARAELIESLSKVLS